MKPQILLILLLTFMANTGYSSVKSYFNHNPKSRYTEPYRKITRVGDDLEAVIIKEILSARKSVFVAVQELRLPFIAKALIEKKQAGLDVRVVLENKYNFTSIEQKDVSTDTNEHDASRALELKMFVDANRNGKLETAELETRDAIYMLRKARIPIIDDTYDGSKGAGLMHHKFIIVDDYTTVVSTANFTMSCIHGDWNNSSSRGNANSMMVIKSGAFADLFTEEFTQMWGNGRIGNFGLKKTYRGARTVTVSGTKITVQFSPTSRSHGWENSVNGLIGAHLNRATKSVKGALFVFSDQQLANVLEKRHKSGAYMGFVIEPKFAFREYSELLDMLGLQLISAPPSCKPEPYNAPWRKPIQDGGMGQMNSGDVLHHKFAVIDGRTVIMGSQNWSDAANHINDETLLVVQNAAISDMYSREFDRVLSRSFVGPSKRLLGEIERRNQACGKRGLNF